MSLDLAVQRLIVLPEVLTIHVQDVFFEFTQFLQLLPVVRTAQKLSIIVVVIIIVVLNFNKCVDEVFEFNLDVRWIDVGSIKHL